MATREDIRRIALQLPGMVASDEGFGLGMIVKGKWKGLVWPWQVRHDPKKGRVPHESYVAVRVGSLTAKEVILGSNSDVYFTEPHYNGYPAVLVRTEAITAEELEDLLIESWRVFASKAEVLAYESKDPR